MLPLLELLDFLPELGRNGMTLAVSGVVNMPFHSLLMRRILRHLIGNMPFFIHFLVFHWRRGWDSNPRYGLLTVQRISNPPH